MFRVLSIVSLAALITAVAPRAQTPDIVASNGVIHVSDAVILPANR